MIEALTTEKRKLYIIQIGKPDCETLTNIIACWDTEGRKHVITWQDMEGAWGCMSIPMTKALTTDKRELYITQIGKPDCETLTNIITCRDSEGKKHVITWQDVEGLWGSITTPPISWLKPKRED